MRASGPARAILLATAAIALTVAACNDRQMADRGPRKIPQLAPSDPDMMWACRWPDGVNYQCWRVPRQSCDCLPPFDDFRDQNNHDRALDLVAAQERCIDGGGRPELQASTATNGFATWIGITCELDSGQTWTENHTTTDICYQMAMGSASAAPSGAEWCSAEF